MREKKFINPASPEMKIRMPVTGSILPFTKEGTAVPMCSYWLRKLRDGDIVVVPQVSAKKERKETEK